MKNKKNYWYYLQGNIRYELFYSKLSFLIPRHIKDQIAYRINSMNMVCYAEGQCKMCGCKTTALQMCDKACNNPCYPAMMSKEQWKEAKLKREFFDVDLQKYWVLDTKNLKFIKRWIG